MPFTVCSYKFACSHHSGLKIPVKVVANISLGEMLHRPLTKGRGSSLLHGSLEFGILSILPSNNFPKIDLVKSPPSLDLPYPPMSITVNL